MSSGGESQRPSNPGSKPPRVDAKSLEETGRLHFFYHSPDSSFPVRDVLNRHGKGLKTEPYLEKSAENYCQRCMQPNIKGFLKSNEKYLFLLTRRSDDRNDKRRYIVGYLTKKKALLRSRRDESGETEHYWAVQGPIVLVPFSDALLQSDLTGLDEWSARRGTKRLNSQQTRRLLQHFGKSDNVFRHCLREVLRLKKRLANGKPAASCSHTCGN